MVDPRVASLLIMVAFAAAAGHVWAHTTSRRALAFWLKPVPVLLMLALVLLAQDVNPATYRLFVALALAASVAGDVLLALPPQAFLPGLVSFLVAHIFYILAFLSIPLVRGFEGTWWLLLPFLAYGAAMLALLWRHVQGILRAAVVVYMAAILTMAWLAGALWLGGAPRSAFVAALFFVASDSVLALTRFRARFDGDAAVVMVTYYTAQMLFALSVLDWVAGSA